jgi:hypothetical protein
MISAKANFLPAPPNVLHPLENDDDSVHQRALWSPTQPSGCSTSFDLQLKLALQIWKPDDSNEAEEHYLIIYTIYGVVSLCNNALRRLLHFAEISEFRERLTSYTFRFGRMSLPPYAKNEPISALDTMRLQLSSNYINSGLTARSLARTDLLEILRRHTDGAHQDDAVAGPL